jgi:hypothetical protein
MACLTNQDTNGNGAQGAIQENEPILDADAADDEATTEGTTTALGAADEEAGEDLQESDAE